MRWLTKISLRLRSLFRRREADGELDSELHFHLEEQIATHISEGMPPTEARRAALNEFGGVEQLKEECRDMRKINWLQDLAQDLRYGLRILRKSPGFAAIAVLTLALGIGANTAIFSVVDALLLKPLPYRDANRLAMVWEQDVALGEKNNVVSPANFLDWQAQNHAFDHMACFADDRANLTGGSGPQVVTGQLTSANFFDVLGVKPILGHAFVPINGTAANDHVAVLSYGLWKERFAANPGIVGSSIELDGAAYTVLGVAPPDFEPFFAEGSLTGERAQFWVPLALLPKYSDRTKVGRFLTVVARLKSGVSLAQARTQMNVIAARLAAKYPQYNGGWGVNVVPIREEVSGAVRPTLLVLLGAVGFVLLIACANIASLFLSRAAGRKREMAVRAALGARRWRIVRQLLSESVLLAFVGGVLGVFLAIWGTDALLHSIPEKLLDISSIPIDFRVLAFAAGVTLLSGLLFGILPSYAAAHSEISASLQETGRGSTLNRRSRMIHSALVVTEIALALVLLAGAGLLIESFSRLTHVNPGFNADHLLTFKLSLPDKYKTDASHLEFFSNLNEKLSHLPGVRSVSMENLAPFNGLQNEGVATDVTLPGQGDLPEAQRPDTAVRVVGPDYFRTLEIPLLAGRTFFPAELAEEKHVVIINNAFARKYFPGTNPIGQKITIDMKDTNVPSEIIGVVGDIHGAELSAKPWPTIYWPYPELAYRGMTIVVRAETDPLALVPAAREVVQSIDKDEPISNVSTMDQLISDSVARSRFSTVLLAIFAALAMVLACIGIYGVMSYATAQRRNEIGIRMALGAQQADVLRLILGHGAKLALLGAAIGIAAALALTRFLSSQLYSTTANDPSIFAAATLLLVAVAIAACYIPARRAMKVDPMNALRYE